MIDYKVIHKHIAVITLNRPEAANALSLALLQQLNDTIKKIDQNPTIYCTILTGANDQVFSAGADLKERHGMSDFQVIAAVQYIGETVSNLEKMPMPVIAVLNGSAFGGGLELALACDLRIATQHAKLGLTETSLAIIPGAGGTQRLARLIGLGQAKKMIYTATPITADKALHIGLVEEIAETDELMNKAIEIANKIIQNGPIALKQAKVAINQGSQVDLSSGLAIEHLCYQQTIRTADRLEGLNAFQEKRQPIYQGK